MTALTGKMQQRRDTAANWSSNNPTLSAGELGWESDTGKLKVGDGATAYNSLVSALATVQTASYTPALTNMAIGTGGTPINTAIYTWIGGAGTGAHGTLDIQGQIRFGSSGQTFPSNPPKIALPTGFIFDDAMPFPGSGSNGGVMLGGVGYWDETGNQGYGGAIGYDSTSTIRLLNYNVGGTNPQFNSVSTSTPFTWAVDDQINYNFTIRAERT